MNLRYIKTISPISGSGRTSLTKYVEDVKNGTNKVRLKLIKKVYQVKDKNQKKKEIAKIAQMGKRNKQSNISANKWDYQRTIQFNILDADEELANSIRMDRHTMILRRNLLDSSIALWFCFKGSKNSHDKVIETYNQYIEKWNKDIKLNVEKVEEPKDQYNLDYDTDIYTNLQAKRFNYKYWKKKFESRKQKVA